MGSTGDKLVSANMDARNAACARNTSPIPSPTCRNTAAPLGGGGASLRSHSAMPETIPRADRLGGPVPTLLTWNVAGLDEVRLDERTEVSCFRALLRDPVPQIV